MARMVREELFSPDEVAILHVMNRTVRQCFLLGVDPLNKVDYSYRKAWIQRHIEYFAKHFGLDLLTYAILSNHFHLVLRSRPDVVKTWDDTEVARRWWMICPKRKEPDGSAAEPTETDLNPIRNDPALLKKVRRRLSDVSWWMRLLCQRLGQRINKEDGKIGKVWNRFKAVRLLDEAALLACSAYVDLNPIRAAVAETMEESEHTSIQKRLQAVQTQDDPMCSECPPPRADRHLAPIHLHSLRDALQVYPSSSGNRCSDKGFLPITELEYVELLDWTARQVVKGKQGFTPETTPLVLDRIGVSLKSWQALVTDFGRLFNLVAGKAHTVASHRGKKRMKRFHMPARTRELMSA